MHELPFEFPNSLENKEKGMFTAYNINYSNKTVILTLILYH